MTEKQENILYAALALFAQEGFKSTSTSKVAKKAGVSEGLIFRHFENKDGLLAAIMEQGEIKAKSLFESIVLENDPEKVIRKTLDIPLQMISNKEDANFWKLQYKLKWELEQYGETKMEPLEQALTRAFSTLEYQHPRQEAQLLLISMDGLATRFFLQNGFDLKSMVEFLKSKYNL